MSQRGKNEKKGVGKRGGRGGLTPIPIPPSPKEVRREPEIPAIELGDTLKVNGTTYNCSASDFIDPSPLGRGAYGEVQRRRHVLTGTELAIKIIPYHSLDEKQKMRDLEISMRLSDNQFVIGIYGALYHEGEIWIFMELMKTSLDKLYTEVKKQNEKIPEAVLVRIAFCVVSALEYLHKVLKVIHRDVKPSNILVNNSGQIKLCDFGVSGILVNSLAKTDVGCKPYMAPERIDSTKSSKSGYDVRSDVWSLGITMVELSTLAFPYGTISGNDFFEMITTVVLKPSPTVPKDLGYSTQLDDFIGQCLMKDVNERPKYPSLLKHEFLLKEAPQTAVSEFLEYITSAVKKNSLTEHGAYQ